MEHLYLLRASFCDTHTHTHVGAHDVCEHTHTPSPHKKGEDPLCSTRLWNVNKTEKKKKGSSHSDPEWVRGGSR